MFGKGFGSVLGRFLLSFCCMITAFPLYAGILTRSADKVLGQPDLIHNGVNSVAFDGAGVWHPYSIAIDTTNGRIFAADFDNSRVIWWNNISGLTNGKSPDGVLGQADFTSGSPNRGGSPAANTLYKPGNMSFDGFGNVWVADIWNSRVIRYTAPFTNGMNSDLVLGQEVFTSSTSNRGSYVAANTFWGPCKIAFNSGDLWITDTTNSRLLKYCGLKTSSITPSSGDNNNSVNVVLTGYDFVAGTILKLTKSGQTEIIASNVNAENSNRITATFDLTDKATGYWNVVISSDSFTNTLANGFEVKYPVTKTTNVDTGTNSIIILNAVSGDITVEIPANTFSETVNVTVSMATLPSSDLETLKQTNIVIEIENDKNLQPSKEITITIKYRDADVASLDETKLVICRYDELNTRWIPLPSTAYPDENKVTGKTSHLSKFALMQLAPASDLSSVRVFPNPFNPRKHLQGLIIDKLTAKANIKIYTISGELVRELKEENGDGRITWDGKNDAGKEVGSDVYIAFIEDSAGTKKVKIAVEK